MKRIKSSFIKIADFNTGSLYGYSDLNDKRDQYKRNVPELSYSLDTLLTEYSRRISLETTLLHVALDKKQRSTYIQFPSTCP